MYELTVIIPTYKEESNIERIITAVDTVLKKNNIPGEILVVDDNSPDRTIEFVTNLKKTRPNLSFLVRIDDHGLSQSVVDGFSHAGSPVFLVMDADLSHPPALIPKMYQSIKDGSDIVVGSRYMTGGRIEKWPLKRRVISHGATFLGRLLFPEVSDPVSGFFAIKRMVVKEAPLKPRGYKILLEVLGKGSWETIKEIPFEFVDRATGSSKLKIKTIVEYAQQVVDITLFSLFHHQSAAWKEWKKVIKFGLVGLSGIFVNMGVLYYLTEFVGFYYLVSSLFAIELSILNNFVWNDLWTFKGTGQHRMASRWHRVISFHAVSAGGLVINMGILYFLTSFVGVYYLISNIIGILVGFGWNFVLNRKITWLKGKES